VLRLVLADQVSVFFAFSAATKATLEVFASEVNGAGVNRVIVGTRSTVRLGTRLHPCASRRRAPRRSRRAGGGDGSSGLVYDILEWG